jgi:hypothetical protein
MRMNVRMLWSLNRVGAGAKRAFLRCVEVTMLCDISVRTNDNSLKIVKCDDNR